MTIDTIDIKTTYGLKLINVGNLLDLPARKKIMEDPGFDAKDLKYVAQKVNFTFFGVYADAASLISNLKAFETLLKSTLKHAVVLPSHGTWFTATAADGFQTTNYLRHKAVKVNLTLTVAVDDVET